MKEVVDIFYNRLKMFYSNFSACADSLEEFIDFCIRNQRYIVRETKEEREERERNKKIELL